MDLRSHGDLGCLARATFGDAKAEKKELAVNVDLSVDKQ